MSGAPAAGPRPSELLYDAVAIGMGAYMASSFRVEVIGPKRFRLCRGDLVVATHRAHSDAPLICSALWVRWGVWHHHQPRLHFAARDDLFMPGFLAGLVPTRSLWIRRVLTEVPLAAALRRVRVHPATTARWMRLGQLLEMLPPETPLAPLLPPERLDGLRERAARRGLPPPGTAGQATGAEYADLLLAPITPAEIPDAAAPGLWRHRTAQAVRAARKIVDLVASGEPLLLFPEGTESSDGAIGPLERSFEGFVRRGRPRRIIPLGIAYDPLVLGRPRAVLGVGSPLSAPTADASAVVLDALCRAVPLTCGQVVASRLLEAAHREIEAVEVATLDNAVADAVVAASRDGRPVEGALRPAASRRERLRECLRLLTQQGLASARGRRTLVLDPDRISASPEVGRLAREHASAAEGRLGQSRS